MDTPQNITTDPEALERFTELVLAGGYRSFRHAVASIPLDLFVTADQAAELSPAFIDFVRAEYLQHNGKLPAVLRDGERHAFTRRVGSALLSLAKAPERVRYMARHFDMLEQFADVLDVARRAGVVLRPADVSPECADALRRRFLSADEATQALRQHWVDDYKPPAAVVQRARDTGFRFGRRVGPAAEGSK